MITSKFYDTVSLADVNEIIPQFSIHLVPVINLSEEDVYDTIRDTDNAIVVIAEGEKGSPDTLHSHKLRISAFLIPPV